MRCLLINSLACCALAILCCGYPSQNLAEKKERPMSARQYPGLCVTAALIPGLMQLTVLFRPDLGMNRMPLLSIDSIAFPIFPSVVMAP